MLKFLISVSVTLGSYIVEELDVDFKKGKEIERIKLESELKEITLVNNSCTDK